MSFWFDKIDTTMSYKSMNQSLTEENKALKEEIQFLLQLLHEAVFPNEPDVPDDRIEVEKCFLDGVLYYRTRENVLVNPKGLAIVGRYVNNKIVKFTPLE